MKFKSLIAVAAFTFMTTSAFAGGVADKIKKKEIEDAVKDRVVEVNTACGSKITFAADLAEFKAADWEGYAPNCDEALVAVKSLCEESDGAYKEAVAKEIKSVKCFPTSGTPSSKVKGSALELHQPKSDIMGSDKIKVILKAAVDK